MFRIKSKVLTDRYQVLLTNVFAVLKTLTSNLLSSHRHVPLISRHSPSQIPFVWIWTSKSTALLHWKSIDCWSMEKKLLCLFLVLRHPFPLKWAPFVLLLLFLVYPQFSYLDETDPTHWQWATISKKQYRTQSPWNVLIPALFFVLISIHRCKTTGIRGRCVRMLYCAIHLEWFPSKCTIGVTTKSSVYRAESLPTASVWFSSTVTGRTIRMSSPLLISHTEDVFHLSHTWTISPSMPHRIQCRYYLNVLKGSSTYIFQYHYICIDCCDSNIDELKSLRVHLEHIQCYTDFCAEEFRCKMWLSPCWEDRDGSLIDERNINGKPLWKLLSLDGVPMYFILDYSGTWKLTADARNSFDSKCRLCGLEGSSMYSRSNWIQRCSRSCHCWSSSTAVPIRRL